MNSGMKNETATKFKVAHYPAVPQRVLAPGEHMGVVSLEELRGLIDSLDARDREIADLQRRLDEALENLGVCHGSLEWERSEVERLTRERDEERASRDLARG